MTNEAARTIELPLDFLGRGRWRATMFSDGARAAQPRETPVAISSRDVRPSDRLKLDLAPSGGQAILFEPL